MQNKNAHSPGYTLELSFGKLTVTDIGLVLKLVESLVCRWSRGEYMQTDIGWVRKIVESLVLAWFVAIICFDRYRPCFVRETDCTSMDASLCASLAKAHRLASGMLMLQTLPG